jgi:3-deoxy-manno-octulosonate cytidylyltransferase (CMP-KDO synthetase)|tara:strand:- start:3 stop:743 length:741 start_codon:yes stop_codon:yes gene_type:complete
MSKTIILIPSRLSASRLPGKPLLRINGLPIICHVFNKAKKTNIGRVVVCAEDNEIINEVKNIGGEAILTSDQHRSGSDRIFEGFKKLEINNIDYILNLQGDEPNIDEKDIINLNNLMINNNPDLGTLATKIKNKSILSNENIVKVTLKEKLSERNFPLATNFYRKNLTIKNENIYHHIGIYIYKVNILEKFINLKQTDSEIKYKLEQMRALDNGIKINVALAKSNPIGIDTKEDYLALKKIMEYKS